MCQCFSLVASGANAHGSASASASASPPQPERQSEVTDEQRETAIDRCLDQTWIDVHAHPGRCFLRGLAPDDVFVTLLGSDNIAPALEDMRAGRVSVACFATVADLRVLGVDESGAIRAQRDFEPGEAHRDHLRQLDALLELQEDAGVQVIRSASEVRAIGGADRIGAIISCEGGDFIEAKPERVEEVYRLGVRSITLVHYRINEIGDIQTENPRHGGLSKLGAEVVAEMNRLGMIIDLAHATFDVTKDVLELSDQPVMVSHSHLITNASSHPRLLSREHACAVAEAGGLIGAWPAGFALANFTAYIDEILRLVDLIGIDHVAIGTDMDANYQPVVSSYRQFPDIAATLLARGMSEDDTAKVMGGNFLSLFESVGGAG